jgi:hypothetical protein
MSEPIPLYQGEPRQQARQRFADLPATPHVQDASGAMEKFQKAVVDAGESIINYHNFNVQQEVQVQESELNIQQQQELDRIFNLANGAEGSWWDKDGKLNTDAVTAWSANWEEKYRNIPRNYWGSKAIRRDQQMLNNELSRQQTLAFAKASAEESRRSRQAFDTNLTLATESENWDKASSIINNAFNVGRISEAERDLSLLRLGKTRERKKLAALKEAGKAGDGRLVTAEMMQSLKAIPAQEVSSVNEPFETLSFSSDSEQDALTMKNAGFASLPSDELMAGFNVAQRLADSGAVTLNPHVGMLEFDLPPSPGASTQKVAGVAQAFKGYSLADYRNSIAKVAAGYFSDERMVGMTDAQLVDALEDEVQMDGAADAWFEGDVLAYKGWLKTELSRLSVTRGSGAVRAADRMMTGAEGRAGLNELLAQEVTQDEIASLGYGFNAVASITKGGLRDKNDVLAPGFRSAVLEYERYRERWAKELAAADSKYTPSDADTPGKRYKEDWQEFGRWYMKQGDLYKTRVEALEEGVRDVYRQRAIDAVATLRETGSFKLGTEVVQLDGKSDWAQEEKVLRYVLRQPLTNSELGTARALTATKERLYQDRRNRAATYAKAAAEHKELLKGKKAAMAEEKKGAEELEKVLKQADDERLAGYSRKVERKVKFGSVSKAGEDEPAVVVVPRKMYAEATGALGTAGGGFYAFIPGVADGIPVMAGDVETVQFNAPVLNLLDGKKNKLTGQQLRALANEGLMVPVQFSAFQKF